MTNYERASSGIRQVFKAEILELIGSVAAVIAAILASAAAVTATSGMAIATGGLAIVAAILAIGGIVVAIIALILKLVGLGRSGKDNSKLKSAFTIAIFTLILTVVYGVLSGLYAVGSVAPSIVDALSKILGIIVTALIIKGCMELNAERSHVDLVERGQSVLTRVVVAFIISTALGIIPAFANGVLELICMLLSVICSIIAYVQFLAYMKRTSVAILSPDVE